jgi:hypothetical protein
MAVGMRDPRATQQLSRQKDPSTFPFAAPPAVFAVFTGKYQRKAEESRRNPRVPTVGSAQKTATGQLVNEW